MMSLLESQCFQFESRLILATRYGQEDLVIFRYLIAGMADIERINKLIQKWIELLQYNRYQTSAQDLTKLDEAVTMEPTSRTRLVPMVNKKVIEIKVELTSARLQDVSHLLESHAHVPAVSVIRLEVKQTFTMTKNDSVDGYFTDAINEPWLPSRFKDDHARDAPDSTVIKWTCYTSATPGQSLSSALQCSLLGLLEEPNDRPDGSLDAGMDACCEPADSVSIGCLTGFFNDSTPADNGSAGTTAISVASGTGSIPMTSASARTKRFSFLPSRTSTGASKRNSLQRIVQSFNPRKRN